ncbi:MAG: YaiI/YqxD family protein [Gammaproteobacteria bacterium]|nr:YaiI/YqxD family protein [Gammaproteobacteria bacterium]
MRVWVDADACPNIIKDILCRAAERTKTEMIFVSNQPIRTLKSSFVKNLIVTAGFDVADNRIIQELEEGDLVISADIPLVDAVISKGGHAIHPRGELYTKNNIKQRLAIRNFNESVRSSGVITGGPDKMTKKDIQLFANCLDQFLTTHR